MSESPRERLLGRVVDQLLAHGLGETSLRALAAQVGTSHRMLIHHFGSRDGLLAAVVEAVEQRQREALAALATTAGSPRATMQAMHERLVAPELAPLERLFFELYVRGLNGGAAEQPLLGPNLATWLEVGAAVYERFGFPPAAAREEATLGVAVARGLLLDLLATGDRARVDAAAARHIDGVLSRRPRA